MTAYFVGQYDEGDFLQKPGGKEKVFPTLRKFSLLVKKSYGDLPYPLPEQPLEKMWVVLACGNPGKRKVWGSISEAGSNRRNSKNFQHPQVKNGWFWVALQRKGC
jgi:hypothetical protein